MNNIWKLIKAYEKHMKTYEKPKETYKNLRKTNKHLYKIHGIPKVIRAPLWENRDLIAMAWL